MPIRYSAGPDRPRPVVDDLGGLERHFGMSRTVLLRIVVADWASRRLTDEHVVGIAAVVGGSNARLESLILSRNRISDVGARMLAAALPLSDSLLTLCLSGNRLSDTGIAVLAEALPHMGWRSQHGPTLEVLRLGNNRVADAGATALGRALPHLRRIVELDHSENFWTMGHGLSVWFVWDLAR